MDRNEKGAFVVGHKSLRMKREGKCMVAECGRQILSRGLCGKHYQRNKKYGNPNHIAKRERKKTGIFVNCLTCGNKFYAYKCNVKRGDGKYCSVRCNYIGQKGERKNIRGLDDRSWRLNKRGYMETTMRRKRFLQHRHIMEKHLGRPLGNDEFIHHKNGVKSDNRTSNLMVLSNVVHLGFHKIERIIRKYPELKQLVRELIV
jgi:hypothetical protein